MKDVLTAPVTVPPALKPAKTTYRIESIDLLRGLIMIIMALDHVRDYFHADSMIFDPTDLSQTNPLLFFTRWITHFCAPVFMFLAGTSAFLVGERKSKKQLSIFLLTRGLWLMFLEVTVVNLGWFLNFHFPFIPLIVIWALGISMIVLSVLIHLPKKLILLIGLLIIAGHNLLDNLHVPGTGLKAFIWAELHEPRRFLLDGHIIVTGYPVLPWIGVMAIGYCFGNFYKKDFDRRKRKKILTIIGIGAILLFIFIRAINIYGDPNHWSFQNSFSFTFLSFLNTTKYPPSLLFILMTLGPAVLFLAFIERPVKGLGKAILHIGRVPMFFYLVHIYFIHLLAMLAAQLSGYKWTDMLLDKWPWLEPQLKGYGFSLSITYLVWFAVIICIYPLCKWYDNYKRQNKEKWWLSYL